MRTQECRGLIMATLSCRVCMAKNQESGVKDCLQSLSHVLQGYGFLLAELQKIMIVSKLNSPCLSLVKDIKPPQTLNPGWAVVATSGWSGCLKTEWRFDSTIFTVITFFRGINYSFFFTYTIIVGWMNFLTERNYTPKVTVKSKLTTPIFMEYWRNYYEWLFHVNIFF